MAKRCFIVHGWGENGRFGRDNVDRLGPLIAEKGYLIEQFDWVTHWYSWHPHALWDMGGALASRVQPGDIAVGYSTGATIIYFAINWHHAPFSQAVLISANLNNDVNFDARSPLEKITVWHSKDDETLASAASMPLSMFGDLGRTGFQGDDPRVVNYDKQEGFAKSSRSHTDMFDDPALFAYFAPLIVKDIPDAR